MVSRTSREEGEVTDPCDVCRYLPDGGAGHQLSVGAVLGAGVEHPPSEGPTAASTGVAAFYDLPGGGQGGVCQNLHQPLPLHHQRLLRLLFTGQAASAGRRQA